MSNAYQKDSRRAQPDPLPGEVAVPERVIVSVAEIAGAAKEGLLALAVGTGLQRCMQRNRPGQPRRQRPGGIPETCVVRLIT